MKPNPKLLRCSLISLLCLFAVSCTVQSDNGGDNEPEDPGTEEPETPSDPGTEEPETPSDPGTEEPEDPSDPTLTSLPIIQYGNDSWSALPKVLNSTKLTADDIDKINDYKDARDKISTISDGLEYIRTEFTNNWSYHGFGMSSIVNNVFYGQLSRNNFDEMIKTAYSEDSMAFNSSQVFLSYLLSDDFEESGVLFSYEKTGSLDAWPNLGTYFKIDNKYHVLFTNDGGSTNCSMDYGQVSYQYANTDTLEEVFDKYKGLHLKGIYALIKDDSDACNTTIEVYDGTISVTENGKMVSSDNDYITNSLTVEAILDNTIFDISEYRVPEAIGKVNLSEDDARELLAGSASEAKEKINSVSDLLTYLYVGGYYTDHGDLQFEDDSGTLWHYNRNPIKVFKDGYGDCGGLSNFAKYMLSDNFKEVGFVNYTFKENAGGGHVTNYIKEGDTYYFFDLTEFCGNRYDPNLVVFHQYSSLEEYAKNYVKKYQQTNLIYTYSLSDGYDMPVCWDDGMSITYVPTGSNYKILFSQNDFTIKEKKMDMVLNRFGGPIRNFDESGLNFATNSYYSELGESKLSHNELVSLTNASIDEVKEKVNNLTDLLKLMYVRGMINYENDVRYTNKERTVYQFNRNAKTVYQSNYGDCGGLANFGHYVLDGDYDENGFVDYTFGADNGGGHVTNYVKKNNKYYFFDLTSWWGSGYNPNGLDLFRYDTKEEYGTKKEYFFADITNDLATYESDNDLIINWKDLNKGTTYYDNTIDLNIILEQNDYEFLPIEISDFDRKAIEQRR